MVNPEKQTDRGGRIDLDPSIKIDDLLLHLIAAGVPLENMV